MSVLMTLRVEGDASALENFAAGDANLMAGIVARAKSHGVISHRFYGSDTEVLVIDEWPSEEAFRAFFAEAGADIKHMMDTAGVRSEPAVSFWRELETGDAVG